ncbi:hypothetical protein KPL70_026448 [Citrus sinensis]|nr:hypothetical protein KPL70_026448 [Citrus sinensis]
MEPQISRRYLWFKTTKYVSDAARRMYSDLGNASQIFEIRSKLKEMKQDEVGGRVMAQKPFPSIDEAFAEVRHEKARQKVMLSDDKSVPPPAPEVSTLMTTKTHSNRLQHPDHRSSKRPCIHGLGSTDSPKLSRNLAMARDKLITHCLLSMLKKKKITILIVYVDDIIVTGNDNKEVEKVKQMMAKEFEVKDFGTLRYFLGMEVVRSKKGIFVSQRKYTLNLLEETGMVGCKPSKTPVELGNKGKMLERGPVDKGQYQRLVGKLIYLSHTRPNIAFAAFTDVDWSGSINDRKSTSGYCTLLWGNLVTWRSKKQSVVARSSAEAEFRAMAHGVCELIWIRRVLKELKIGFEEHMLLYCDNKLAISIAHNHVHHDRTKHVEVDRHFIKEKLDGNIIKLEYVPTSHQLADILTKGLSEQTHEFPKGKVGLINIDSQA